MVRFIDLIRRHQEPHDDGRDEHAKEREFMENLEEDGLVSEHIPSEEYPTEMESTLSVQNSKEYTMLSELYYEALKCSSALITKVREKNAIQEGDVLILLGSKDTLNKLIAEIS